MGSVDLMTRPINSCEGEYPDCNGVDLYASNAFSGSLDFFKMFFAVCTARSTSSFDLGKAGLLVTTLHPHSLANAKYSALSKGGPLSERSVSGIPCLANKLFRTRKTSEAVLFLFMAPSSMYLE